MFFYFHLPSFDQTFVREKVRKRIALAAFGKKLELWLTDPYFVMIFFIVNQKLIFRIKVDEE